MASVPTNPVGVFALILVIAGRLSGFEPQAPAAPAISVTTQLVQIAVVAEDSSGSPVTDLARRDFRIIQGRTERRISVFRSSADATVATNSVAPRFGKYSNISGAVSPRSQNILLLDAIDTYPQSWQRAWPQILSFLKSLRPADSLAVYILTPATGLQVAQDYDDDTRALLARLQSTTHPTALTLLPPEERQDQLPPSFARREAGVDMPELLSLGHVESLAGAFQAIAGHLFAIPGSKSLIWFAGSFPNAFDHQEYPVLEAVRVRLLRAVQRLISANVAIFPVDARGLIPDRVFDVENQDLPIAGLSGPTDPYPFSNDKLSNCLEYAQQSGGEAYFNTNGLAAAIKKASLLGSGRYTLGFYLSGQPDNKFHRVQIEVVRPGVRLRYKPGYWAIAPEAPDSTDRELKTALESPFTAEGIQIEANTSRISGEQMAFDLYVNSRDVRPIRNHDDWSATLDVIIGQKDASGRVFAVPPYRVPLVLSQSSINANIWLTTQGRIAVRQQSKFIRIVVRDEVSGNIGSVDIPIESHGARATQY